MVGTQPSLMTTDGKEVQIYNQTRKLSWIFNVGARYYSVLPGKAAAATTANK
jgi:hypothetical protein